MNDSVTVLEERQECLGDIADENRATFMMSSSSVRNICQNNYYQEIGIFAGEIPYYQTNDVFVAAFVELSITTILLEDGLAGYGDADIYILFMPIYYGQDLNKVIANYLTSSSYYVGASYTR